MYNRLPFFLCRQTTQIPGLGVKSNIRFMDQDLICEYKPFIAANLGSF